jgi:methionine-gamma-lyase
LLTITDAIQNGLKFSAPKNYYLAAKFTPMAFNPANAIQDLQYFGEFGGVNPSISDSSTYTFLAAKTMFDTFEGNADGCYLYSRHSTPSNLYLAGALAAMENTEAALVTASGMGAICPVFLHLCQAGDHVVSSRTIYGGTYAFLKNFAPKFQLKTDFVDITNLEQIEAAITPQTKILYCETVSNPLMEIADIAALSVIAKRHDLKLVVDNTFSPLSVAPANLGADIVIHSLTKFINGSSDTMAGVLCTTRELVDDMCNVTDGAAMLLGSTLDSLRAASIMKNLRTLHVRMPQHSKNALYFAQQFEADGIRTLYPGLKSHKSHELYQTMMHPDYGYGGMLAIDVQTEANASALMEAMQERNVGYLAVSLGFYRTLFSASGSSTSSEIPEEEQISMGLSPGLIRLSVGLDCDAKASYLKIKEALKAVGLIN